MSSQIPLPHLHSGKVRDVYDAGDDRLLMVTSDRISAFDVVMVEPIADKGRVLTAMTSFWFEQFSDTVSGHLIATETEAVDEALGGGTDPDLLADLAERRDPVEVLLVGGARRHGHIETVGTDLVGVRLDDRRLALVARRALAAIRPDRGVPDLVGDRTVHRDGPRLREVLDELVADQPRVTVTLVGTLEPVDGVLERLGRDVLLVREADGTATHLPVGAVVEVLVAD